MNLLLPIILLALHLSPISAQSCDHQPEPNPQQPPTTSPQTIKTETEKLIQVLTPYKEHIRQAVRADSDPTSVLTCSLCSGLLPIAIGLVRLIEGNEVVKGIAVEVCKVLGLAPDDYICPDIIESYGDQVLFILRNQPVGNKGTELCGILSSDCERTHPQLIDWSVGVDVGERPERVDREKLDPDTTTYKTFLQFTDIHLDLDYVVGMNAECGDGIPICCRERDGVPRVVDGEVVGREAGMFGDFKCALPESAFVASLEDAGERYSDADYIFLTGDYIHSGVWLYNQTENARHVSRVVSKMIEKFPGKKIFPITGNHEPHVVNMYVPPDLWCKGGDFNMSWLYPAVMGPFLEESPGLIDGEEVRRFMEWGYYSVEAEEGLRFVFINTNVCYDGNFWLGFDAKDPGGQLGWLAKVLEGAENDGEAVYVIGHVEPGDCFGHWSGEFNRVVSRFEGVVKGMFFGHSHKPQYRVHFLTGSEEEVLGPVSIISGSLLTDGMNPAYSAYRVDGGREGGGWGLLRHEVVALLLGESNRVGEAVFRKVHDSWEDFGLEGFSGGEVLGLGRRMICDQGLLDAYLRFHHKGNDSSTHKPCSIDDLSCKLPLISDFVRTNAEDSAAREEFLNYIRYTNCSGGKFFDGYDNSGGGLVVGVVVSVVVAVVVGLLG